MTLLADNPTVAPEPEAPAPLTRGPRRQSWLRGWKVPVRLARRDLRRRPGRTVLVALLVAVPVTALVLADASYRTSQAEQGAWIPRTFGTADALATVSADPRESNCQECSSRDDVEAMLPDGTRRVWWTLASIPLRTPEQRKSFSATVSNANAADPLLRGRYVLLRGVWPTADNEVALHPSSQRFLMCH